jgi:hypothetical protein
MVEQNYNRNWAEGPVLFFSLWLTDNLNLGKLKWPLSGLGPGLSRFFPSDLRLPFVRSLFSSPSDFSNNMIY